MKALIYSIIIAAIMLTICFLISLIRWKKTKKNQKTTLLILPVCILLLFIALFVGASISRNHIKKELIELKESTDKRNDDIRLSVLEKKYNDLILVIGRDEATEVLIRELSEK